MHRIIRRVLWLEPLWIVLVAPSILLRDFLWDPWVQPWIVAALFLFWPLRWWHTRRLAPPTRMNRPLALLLLWLPVTLWASSDVERSWAALGYLVLGITGFGSALIVVPLLAWRWPLPEVVALALLMDAPASALLGGLNLRQVDGREVRRLLPGMLVGAVVGLLIADALPTRWPLAALGLYVAVIGLQALRAPGGMRSTWPAQWAPAAGGLAGLVQMIFGAAGPVFLAWLQHRPVDVRTVRATVPAVMLLAIAAVVAVKGAAGQLSSAV